MKNVLENGVFYAANKLYGLSFKERTDLPMYHPDVRWSTTCSTRTASSWRSSSGDLYARASKRGGAWMNTYVDAVGADWATSRWWPTT